MPRTNGLPEFRTVALGQLSQNGEQIIEEMNRTGTPVLLTRHGRYVGLLEPASGSSAGAWLRRGLRRYRLRRMLGALVPSAKP